MVSFNAVGGWFDAGGPCAVIQSMYLRGEAQGSDLNEQPNPAAVSFARPEPSTLL